MFNPDGTPQALKEKAISRTYVYAYQGIPEFTYFSASNGGYAT
jgi:hypothetical protein